MIYGTLDMFATKFKENFLKTDSQSALADTINHFLTEQADRLDVFRGFQLCCRIGLLFRAVFVLTEVKDDNT